MTAKLTATPVAPVLEFITKGCGRGFGYLPPAAIARDRTGRNRETGERHLGVAVENRRNEMVRFDCEAWKLDLDFSDIAQQWLLDYWHRQNRRTPARLLKRMERHFGPTHFRFDTLQAEAGDWRDFLTVVLSDAGSYAHVLAGEGQ